MTSDKESGAIDRVLEIEVAEDGDHSTHEETVTVYLVGSRENLHDELVKAARMVDMKRPGFDAEGASACLNGTDSLEDGECRHLIEENVDNVIFGPEVPVWSDTGVEHE